MPLARDISMSTAGVCAYVADNETRLGHVHNRTLETDLVIAIATHANINMLCSSVVCCMHARRDISVSRIGEHVSSSVAVEAWMCQKIVSCCP